MYHQTMDSILKSQLPPDTLDSLKEMMFSPAKIPWWKRLFISRHARVNLACREICEALAKTKSNTHWMEIVRNILHRYRL